MGVHLVATYILVIIYILLSHSFGVIHCIKSTVLQSKRAKLYFSLFLLEIIRLHYELPSNSCKNDGFVYSHMFVLRCDITENMTSRAHVNSICTNYVPYMETYSRSIDWTAVHYAVCYCHGQPNWFFWEPNHSFLIAEASQEEVQRSLPLPEWNHQPPAQW